MLGVFSPAFWLLLAHAFLFGFFSGGACTLIGPIVIQLVRSTATFATCTIFKYSQPTLSGRLVSGTSPWHSASPRPHKRRACSSRRHWGA
jgi:hypothetical protein